MHAEALWCSLAPAMPIVLQHTEPSVATGCSQQGLTALRYQLVSDTLVGRRAGQGVWTESGAELFNGNAVWATCGMSFEQPHVKVKRAAEIKRI